MTCALHLSSSVNILAEVNTAAEVALFKEQDFIISNEEPYMLSLLSSANKEFIFSLFRKIISIPVQQRKEFLNNLIHSAIRYNSNKLTQIISNFWPIFEQIVPLCSQRLFKQNHILSNVEDIICHQVLLEKYGPEKYIKTFFLPFQNRMYRTTGKLAQIFLELINDSTLTTPEKNKIIIQTMKQLNWEQEEIYTMLQHLSSQPPFFSSSFSFFHQLLGEDFLPSEKIDFLIERAYQQSQIDFLIQLLPFSKKLTWWLRFFSDKIISKSGSEDELKKILSDFSLPENERLDSALVFFWREEEKDYKNKYFRPQETLLLGLRIAMQIQNPQIDISPQTIHKILFTSRSSSFPIQKLLSILPSSKIGEALLKTKQYSDNFTSIDSFVKNNLTAAHQKKWSAKERDNFYLSVIEKDTFILNKSIVVVNSLLRQKNPQEAYIYWRDMINQFKNRKPASRKEWYYLTEGLTESLPPFFEEELITFFQESLNASTTNSHLEDLSFAWQIALATGSQKAAFNLWEIFQKRKNDFNYWPIMNMNLLKNSPKAIGIIFQLMEKDPVFKKAMSSKVFSEIMKILIDKKYQFPPPVAEQIMKYYLKRKEIKLSLSSNERSVLWRLPFNPDVYSYAKKIIKNYYNDKKKTTLVEEAIRYLIAYKKTKRK